MTETLKVPGATLSYAVCGTGPTLLLIPGGAMDSGPFTGIRDRLSDRYTVVTYEPRGLLDSPFDDEPRDTTVPEYTDDAHRLLASIGSEPAFVLGSSGGALVGLDLATRYPEQVRFVVAHEPPCTGLLDDADKHERLGQDVHDALVRDGVGAAMATFFAGTGWTPDLSGPTGDPTPERIAAAARMRHNMEFFVAHMLLPVGRFAPDVDAIRSRPVAVAVGDASAGQVACRAAEALSALLGQEPELFPGDHVGFDAHAEAFAVRLHEVLATH